MNICIFFKHAKLLTVLSAFSISLFPLNYFFQFLYYTDSGSTLFVLVSYYLMLKKFYQGSAYVAALAILFRQTNVIWLIFHLALLLIGNLENLVSKSTNNAGSQASSKKNAGICLLLNKIEIKSKIKTSFLI